MRTRRWSVRGKIVALLAVPVLSLVVLWAVVAGLTLRAGLDLRAAQTYHDRARVPGEDLVTELQRERRLSVVYLGGNRADPRPLAAAIRMAAFGAANRESAE